MKLLKIKTLMKAMQYLDLLAKNAQNCDTLALMRHQVKLNLIHLVEERTTLGNIMTSKPSLHL